MVEIAKALMFSAEIVIMDEPTSALSDAEVARLFRVIADLRKAGTTVLYISHKMNEVFTLADRVTVLRDGKFVATATRAETDPGQVVRWMVGREIAALNYQPHPVGDRPMLTVRDLNLPTTPGSGRPSLSGIEFDLHAGEVLGVAGLLGAGRTELLEALFGASPVMPAGAITLDGQPARFGSPGAAIDAGLALVTEDRKTLGLFNAMTVGENITIAALDRFSWPGGLVNPAREASAIADRTRQLAIKTAGPRAAVTSLSGGNQQKCILARWLLTNPKVLLLDEPTRGIDVGAKSEIYALIRRLASEGMAIIMTSSELPELLAVADRILVLCEGRRTAILPRGRHRGNDHARGNRVSRSRRGRLGVNAGRFRLRIKLKMRVNHGDGGEESQVFEGEPGRLPDVRQRRLEGTSVGQGNARRQSRSHYLLRGSPDPHEPRSIP